jgi:hypothetical protein
MKSITVRSHIGADGLLELRVPTDFVNRDVEVVVVVQPLVSDDTLKGSDELGWPRSFFEQTYGSIPDLADISRTEHFDQRDDSE